MNHLTSLGGAIALTLAATSATLAESRDFSNLGPFTSVNASAGLDVRINHGDTQTIRAEADDAGKFDDLEVSVENGVLTLTRNGGFLDFILDGGIVGALFGSHATVRIDVSAPDLIAVNADSGSNVEVGAFEVAAFSASASSGAGLDVDNITATSMNLSASSGADLKISGTCTELSAEASSGADLDASDLICTDGNASASSGADLDINISGSITADASSGSDITIAGRPASTDLRHSSGGDVHVTD